MANKVAESGMIFDGSVSFSCGQSPCCYISAGKDGIYLTTAFGRRCINDMLAEQCQEIQDVYNQENRNAET